MITNGQAIAIEQVHFRYNERPILINVSFEVPEGKLIGLVGPNGSGKTTLLRLVLGLLKLQAGRISVLGHDVARLAPIRDQIGYVPQNTRIGRGIPVTVREMVKMGRYRFVGPLRALAKHDEERVDWAIRALEMEQYAREYVAELSDGLQQRAAIARALAKGPRLLCLDEPASSLDVSSRRVLYRLLRTLRDEHEITQFVISHDLQLLGEQADGLVLMDHHVIAAGCPTDVMKKVTFDRAEAEFAGCRDHDHG